MLPLARQGGIDSFLTRLVVQLVAGRERETEALELLLAALGSDPLNVELLWAQSNLYQISERLEEAKQPLLTAISLAPDNPELYDALARLAEGQEEFADSLEWRRRALLADPGDPNYAHNIAGDLYLLDLNEEGDAWLRRVRAIDPDRMDLIVRLEIMSAYTADDQDRLIAILEEALPMVLTSELHYFVPTVLYPSVMAQNGRSREALDYLSELIPGLQDYSKLISNSRFAQYMQIISFGLQRDIRDEESYRQLVSTFENAVLAEYGADWRENTPPINEIIFDVWKDSPDGAKQVFLETHKDWTMFNGQWLQLQIYPWLEDLR
jgi:tetratricopeptide (TPR) repeat protein